MVFGSDTGVQMESILPVFCCVMFPFITSILMFACARKCSKVLPSDAVVGGAHFFIMHENKKSHWVKWDKPYNNARQTIGNTHWDNCSVGFFFFSFFFVQEKQGVLFKMLWMSLAYFMFLLPYNKVLL